MNRYLRKVLSAVLSALFYLAIWWAASVILGKPIILPSPPSVFHGLTEIFSGREFYISVFFTILRFAAAFAVSLLLGLIIPSISLYIHPVRVLFMPLMLAMRSIPVIALILASLVWFSSDLASVFIGITVMLPLIYISVSDGLQGVERDYLEFAYVFKIGKMRMLKHIYMPSSIEFLFSSLSNAAGIGLKSVIAAEVIAKPLFGMGTGMHNAQTYLKMDELIAWTMTAVFLSFLTEYALRVAGRKIVRWRKYD